MEFCIENGSLFKDIVMTLKDFSASVVFQFGVDGMSMQCMDSSHVSMAQLCFGVPFFKHFVCENKGWTHRLGVSVEHLVKLFKLVNAKTSIEWRYSLSKQDHVQVTMTDPMSRYDFKLRLMDIDDDELEIPQLDYTHVFSIESSIFKKSLADIADFGDSLVLQCTNGVMNLKVTGDAGEMVLEKQIDLQNDKLYSGNFNTKYMVLFSKADKVSPKIELSMSEGMPIQMKYVIDDKSYFLMFVAPRINEDMDI